MSDKTLEQTQMEEIISLRAELAKAQAEVVSLQCAENDRKNALELADRIRMERDKLKADNARLAAHLKVMEQRTGLEIIYKGKDSALHDLLAPTIRLLEQLQTAHHPFMWSTDCKMELARLRAVIGDKA